MCLRSTSSRLSSRLLKVICPTLKIPGGYLPGLGWIPINFYICLKGTNVPQSRMSYSSPRMWSWTSAPTERYTLGQAYLFVGQLATPPHPQGVGWPIGPRLSLVSCSGECRIPLGLRGIGCYTQKKFAKRISGLKNRGVTPTSSRSMGMVEVHDECLRSTSSRLSGSR